MPICRMPVVLVNTLLPERVNVPLTVMAELPPLNVPPYWLQLLDPTVIVMPAFCVIVWV